MGGKGSQVTSSASIPPELAPLYRQAVSQINQYGQQNPLGQFGASNPEQVAGLSYNQRLAEGNAPSLYGTSPLEALALQSIMKGPALAGVTSTSGAPDMSGQPSLLNYYSALGGAGAPPQAYSNPNVAAVPPGPPLPTPPPGTGGSGDTGGPGNKGATGATALELATGAARDANGNIIGGRPGASTPIGGAPASGGTPTVIPPRVDNTGQGGLVEPQPTTPDLSSLLGLGGQPSYSGGPTVANSPGVQAGYKQVTGSDLINDPAVAAALKSFSSTVQPGIINQAGLMGLGRSDSANRAVATAQGSMLAPLYENAFARQQQTNQLGYQATEAELARRDAAARNIATATSNQAGQLAGLAGQRYGELTGAIGTGLQAGGQAQTTTQQGLTSAFNDFLRRQGLSEQSTYAPFGSVVGGTVGSKSVSSGK
jgi:hypothetical protein